MKTLQSAISVLIILSEFGVKAGDQPGPGPDEWCYVDFFPKTFTYRYLGKTPEGIFRFKPVGPLIEPWTPEIILQTGETTDGGILTVLGSVGDDVEIQVAPGNKRIRLEVNDDATASTIFVGFHPKAPKTNEGPFFTEVGKRFRFPTGETEFDLIEADSKSLKVVPVDRSSDDPITFQRLPRTQPTNKGRQGAASPPPAP
jgi:hypothetical protein